MSYELKPTDVRSGAENRRSQLYKGLAEMALLCVLRSRAHYGLELLDVLNREVGLELADGTIYPLLHRLERAGWITAEWQTETENGRPRKYYALTTDGRTELAAMLADWRVLRARLDPWTDGEMP